eukprot:2212316-Rhodomonas_salina.2
MAWENQVGVLELSSMPACRLCSTRNASIAPTHTVTTRIGTSGRSRIDPRCETTAPCPTQCECQSAARGEPHVQGESRPARARGAWCGAARRGTSAPALASTLSSVRSQPLLSARI